MPDTLAAWAAEVERAAHDVWDSVPLYMRNRKYQPGYGRGTTQLLFVGP